MIRTGLVAVACFGVITLLVAGGATDGVDEWWNDLMVDAETAWLVDVADALRVLGSTAVAIAITGIGVIAFLVLRRWSDAASLAAIAVAAFAVSQIVKVVIDRERPPDALDVETSASYPSQSVMVTAGGIVLGLAVLAGRSWPAHRSWVVPAAIAYVVAMAWSRTYVRAHWLSDVVGGAAGGVAVVTLVVAGSIALAARGVTS